MKRHHVILAFLGVLFVATLLLDACSTGLDEDAAVSTAPAEYVEAFALLDSLAEADGGLVRYFSLQAYQHGYRDALEACALACAIDTDSVCAEAPSPARVHLQPTGPR